ncbi:MAG: hypothetical protein D6785_02505 [Planctomycetota bacterium]|nr:MAG: hypothetical protein D6785_02505 [Planctomycetota bacterium]
MGIAKNPIVEISGVFLDTESIAWAMLTGPNAHREQFEVTGVISEKLNALKNPVSLRFEANAFKGAKSQLYSVTFKNLYLTEVKRQTGYLHTWEISDQRILWEGRKVSRMYNIHWGGYENKSLLPKAGRFFADYALIQNLRYAKWSLKQAGKIAFIIPRGDINITAEVWTAKQIIQDILENVLGVKDYIDKLPDNGFQPENLTFDMEPVDSALNTVLKMAHGTLYQNPDGKIVLISLNEPDDKMIEFVGQFDFLDGVDLPFKQDLSRVRPGKIRVGFEKQYEILFKYSEDPLALGRPRTVLRNSSPPLQLENILQLPDTFISGGKKYYKGSWIPVFEALNLWNNDKSNPPPSGKPLTKSELLRRWLSENYLEFVYASYSLKGIPRQDEIWANRIAALRHHFRKTFRVNQFWAQRVKEFKAERATLLDPITGRREPSPVFMNYTQIATFRKLLKSKNPNAHIAAQIIKKYPKDGKFENAIPCPAVVNMLDANLGIFSVDFLEDPAYFVMKFIPGEVDPIPKVAAGMSQDLTLWGRVSLKSDFRLAVILSVIFAIPNSKKNKLFFDFKLDNGNDKIETEIYSTQDNARYRFGNNMSVEFQEDGDVIVRGAKLDNEEVIKAIADAEKKQVEFSWIDRIETGTFTAIGYKSGWEPRGWIKSISVQYNTQFGLVTTVSMTDAQAKPLLNFLGPKVRHILQKSILSRNGI